MHNTTTTTTNGTISIINISKNTHYSYPLLFHFIIIKLINIIDILMFIRCAIICIRTVMFGISLILIMTIATDIEYKKLNQRFTQSTRILNQQCKMLYLNIMQDSSAMLSIVRNVETGDDGSGGILFRNSSLNNHHSSSYHHHHINHDQLIYQWFGHANWLLHQYRHWNTRLSTYLSTYSDQFLSNFTYLGLQCFIPYNAYGTLFVIFYSSSMYYLARYFIILWLVFQAIIMNMLCTIFMHTNKQIYVSVPYLNTIIVNRMMMIESIPKILSRYHSHHHVISSSILSAYSNNNNVDKLSPPSKSISTSSTMFNQNWKILTCYEMFHRIKKKPLVITAGSLGVMNRKCFLKVIIYLSKSN